MLSMSIIGHPGGGHSTAQQIFAQSHFQILQCVDLDHEQTLQAALRESGHTLLVYCPPGVALAQALAPDSETACDQTLQNWSDNARALLRHYMHNRERCTLVNELALLHTPNKVLETLAHKTDQPMATETAPDNEQTLRPILEALGASIAYADPYSTSLYRDLETVADVSGEVAMRQYQTNLQKAFGRIATERSKLSHAAEQHHEQSQQLQKENERLLEQLHQTQEALAHSSSEYKKLADAASAPSTAPDPSEANQNSQKLQELQEENELLLLQLHQTQEELEHYFCEFQKLSESDTATPCSTPQTHNMPAGGLLLETLFDLREEEIVGANWYEAEHDGRWAGQGIESTLSLPPLGQGRFELTFDIVHALDNRIVKDMQVLLNDTPLKLSHKFGKLPFKRFPCQVRTQIDTTNEPQTTWQLRLCFPKTVSPAEKGSDDLRQLTIRLRTIRVRALTTPHKD